MVMLFLINAVFYKLVCEFQNIVYLSFHVAICTLKVVDMRVQLFSIINHLFLRVTISVIFILLLTFNFIRKYEKKLKNLRKIVTVYRGIKKSLINKQSLVKQTLENENRQFLYINGFIMLTKM